jgi:hypothetical protein
VVTATDAATQQPLTYRRLLDFDNTYHHDLISNANQLGGAFGFPPVATVDAAIARLNQLRDKMDNDFNTWRNDFLNRLLGL